MLKFVIRLWFLIPIIYGLKEYKINLDIDPHRRFDEVTRDNSKQICSITKDIEKVIPSDLFWLFDIIANNVERNWPSPYREEIIGIYETGKVSCPDLLLSDIVLANVLYDFTAHCTSIVGENSDGHVIHGRNLDFDYTDQLRGMVFLLNFESIQKNISYKVVGFPGVIGVNSGQKDHGFSLSLNQRFTMKEWEEILRFWIDSDAWPATVAARSVFDQFNSFNSAVQYMSTISLISPAYYIMAGNEHEQGVVITRDADRAVDIYPININDGRWYVLETNYDRWTTPKPGDDRRDPAIHLLNGIGRQRFNKNTLLSVLDTKPIVNNLTIYTCVMSPQQPELFQVILR
ncbi:hypothetical protein SNEBB_000049 [Seison nebaliae]|nr:hypothetical protein SNEBB_000049 [Seison nebaliae]